MPLQFPLVMSFDDISKLEHAADAFSWDESEADEESLFDRIADYATAFNTAPQLANYLKHIGYTVDEAHGVLILNANAIRIAHALFETIQYEYDATDLPELPHPTITGATQSATWQLFGLGGDDDVDYCGTQPSCLTDLLLRHLEA